MSSDVPGSAAVRSRVRAMVLGVAALALVGLPGPAGAASLDLDRDGLRNTFETGRSLTNPRLADTDHDGTPDGAEDPDADGLPNVAEQAAGTNPRASDTDRDGTGDATDPDPLHAPAPVLPGAESCTVFPVTNVWNTPIDARPVRADSATLIGSIGRTRTFHMDFGSNEEYGIPYQVVDASTPRHTVSFEYDDESDPGPYPIPDAPLIEGGSDGHSSWSTPTRAGSTSCTRPTSRRRLVRRLRRDVGPDVERAPAEGWTAPTPPACRSCPASCATTRSSPADPPRAPVHGPADPRATSTRLGTGRRRQRARPCRRWASASASRRPSTSPACRTTRGSSRSRSSATG